MPKFKTTCVKFEDSKYNYSTSVNPNLSDKEIKSYFVGTSFDMGIFPNENMQKCINCEVLPPEEI